MNGSVLKGEGGVDLAAAHLLQIVPSEDASPEEDTQREDAIGPEHWLLATWAADQSMRCLERPSKANYSLSIRSKRSPLRLANVPLTV